MSSPGLRERKKLATAHAIRKAALELVLERGLAHVSVEDIAAAADVSPRTFFNYFPCKEDALVGPDPDRLAELSEMLRGRPAEETPVQALRAVMLERAKHIAHHSDDITQKMQLVHDYPELLPRHLATFTSIERAIAEVVAERTGTDVDADVYPHLLAAAAASAMRQSVLRWRLTGEKKSLTAYFNDAFDALEQGFLPPTRSKRKSRT